MAELAVAILSVLAFAGALLRLHIVHHAERALERAGTGVAAMFDPSLDEDEQERAVQSAGLKVLASTGQIAWRFAACLAAAALPVIAADQLRLVVADTVLELMMSWPFLVGSTVVLGGFAFGWTRWHKGEGAFSRYSAADRMLHKLAFAGPGLQLAAADFEKRVFARTLSTVADRPPVFITSLPRAGTTVLLNALHQLPDVATQTYRDMPFVLSPLLWSRIAGRFGRSNKPVERAHGDGLKIGYDSPEAFEEVIWRTFWPQKYHDGARIDLWTKADLDPEARAFLTTHFRKIVALRSAGHGRYVSKNNGNIARLDLLGEMFPDASIIVPIRPPAEHAASLLRQHRNFVVQHQYDPFVARYMRDIGHLEFGALHTPVGFEGFAPGELTPNDPDYWLSYWLAAYRHVLIRADSLLVVPQDLVCAEPDRVMHFVCATTGLKAGDTGFASLFRTPKAQADTGDFSQTLLADADALYAELSDRGIAGKMQAAA